MNGFSLSHLLVLLLALSACRAKGNPSVDSTLKVPLAVVNTALVQETEDYLAMVQSRRSVLLRTPVEGRVVKLFVHPGEQVKEGQSILQLHDAKQDAVLRSYQAAQQKTHTERDQALALLTAYEADWSAKQVQFKLMQQQCDRLERLHAQQIVSRQEQETQCSRRDTTQEELRALEARVAAQKAQVASSEQALIQSKATSQVEQEQLKRFVLSAPFDGVVGDLLVRQGEQVEAHTPLTTLDQHTCLDVAVRIPAEQSGKLHDGLPLQLLGVAGEELLRTPLSFVSPQVDSATQTLLVKAPLPEQKTTLRAGQWVRVRVIWNEHTAPVLPRTAVFSLNDQPFVFVATHDQGGLKAIQRPVQVSPLQGDTFPVLSGVHEGDSVVTSIPLGLTHGTAIAPAP